MKMSVKSLKKLIENAVAESAVPGADVVVVNRKKAMAMFPDAFPADEDDPAHMPDYGSEMTYAVIDGVLYVYDPMDVIDHAWLGPESGWVERIDAGSQYADMDDNDFSDVLYAAAPAKNRRAKNDKRDNAQDAASREYHDAWYDAMSSNRNENKGR